MKLSEQQTLKFVTLYRQHRCLWDRTHKFYTVKRMRNDALNKIIVDFGMPGMSIEEVKKKIKNLRSTYNLELDKIDACSGGYTPKLVWYNEMDAFIRSVTRKTQNPVSVYI